MKSNDKHLYWISYNNIILFGVEEWEKERALLIITHNYKYGGKDWLIPSNQIKELVSHSLFSFRFYQWFLPTTYRKHSVRGIHAIVEQKWQMSNLRIIQECNH